MPIVWTRNSITVAQTHKIDERLVEYSNASTILHDRMDETVGGLSLQVSVKQNPSIVASTKDGVRICIEMPNFDPLSSTDLTADIISEVSEAILFEIGNVMRKDDFDALMADSVNRSASISLSDYGKRYANIEAENLYWYLIGLEQGKGSLELSAMGKKQLNKKKDSLPATSQQFRDEPHVTGPTIAGLPSENYYSYERLNNTRKGGCYVFLQNYVTSGADAATYQKLIETINSYGVLQNASCYLLVQNIVENRGGNIKWTPNPGYKLTDRMAAFARVDGIGRIASSIWYYLSNDLPNSPWGTSSARPTWLR